MIVTCGECVVFSTTCYVDVCSRPRFHHYDLLLITPPEKQRSWLASLLVKIPLGTTIWVVYRNLIRILLFFKILFFIGIFLFRIFSFFRILTSFVGILISFFGILTFFFGIFSFSEIYLYSSGFFPWSEFFFSSKFVSSSEFFFSSRRSSGDFLSSRSLFSELIASSTSSSE